MTSNKLFLLLFWVFCLLVTLTFAKKKEEKKTDEDNLFRCGAKYGSCRPGECCSKYGWCGKTNDHCSVAKGCQSEFGVCDDGKKEGEKIKEETDTNVFSDDEDDLYRCGGKYGKCGPGECCSKYGWCGKTDDYCSVAKGCQSEFGVCDDGKKEGEKIKEETDTNVFSDDEDDNFRCGGKYGKCRPGECCSKYGWCGKSDSYCSVAKGCQSKFGVCNDDKKTEQKSEHHGHHHEHKTYTSTIKVTKTVVTTQVEESDNETTTTTQSNTPTTEPNTPTTEPNTPTTEPNTPTTEPNTPTTEPNTPTTEPNTPTTEPNIPTTEPNTPTTEPNTPTTEPNTTTTEPTTSITETTTPTTEPNTPTTEPNTTTTEPTTSITETTTPTTEPTCLGQTSLCNGQIGVRIDGQLYCYNTESELSGRCREAVPGQTFCHPGEGCFYAGNYFGEDTPGNCNWGYFSQNDANNFCKDLGGRLLNETEMNDVWSAFVACNPPMGKVKNEETCYWTSTKCDGGFYRCRGNPKMYCTRKDGYSHSGGAFCKMINKTTTTTEPNTPTTEPNTSTTEPNTSTTEPNTPITEPNTPTTEPNTPTTEPNTPTTEPNTPTTEPNTPTTEPNTPTTEPNTPTTEPNTPTTEPNTPTTEPNTPTTEPNTPTTEPNTPTTEPNTPTTEPNTPTTEPNTPTTEPNTPATEPNTPTTEPNTPTTEPNTTTTEPTTSITETTTPTTGTTCLGQTSLCNGQMGVRIDGQLYCYNTESELSGRCREAVPKQTYCHPGEGCFYAGNYYGEDTPGNCNWGYFSQNDANNFCKDLGGQLLNKTEMNDVWSAFVACNPPMGKVKNQETCYWTSTKCDSSFYRCRSNSGMNCTRKDGYSHSGGALCKM